MPSISPMRITPDNVPCGGTVDIEVTVTFAGPPRDVRVVFDIEPPCAFSGETRSVLMRRDGPSPQSFRLLETVSCPPGDVLRPRIVATATDASGSDRSHGRVRVAC